MEAGRKINKYAKTVRVLATYDVFHLVNNNVDIVRPDGPHGKSGEAGDPAATHSVNEVDSDSAEMVVPSGADVSVECGPLLEGVVQLGGEFPNLPDDF